MEWRPQVRGRGAPTQPGEAAAPTADLLLARPVDAALAEPVGLVEWVIEDGVARLVHQLAARVALEHVGAVCSGGACAVQRGAGGPEGIPACRSPAMRQSEHVFFSVWAFS